MRGLSVLLSGLLSIAVQPRAQQQAESAPAAAPVTVTGLPQGVPLAITATATTAALTVRVQIESGWHLYGRDTGGGQPVSIECLADSAFTASGPLRMPVDDRGQITGKADLVLPLRGAAGGELRARMSFMICDALQCLPPIQVALAGRPAPAASTPLAVLLVAVADDARAARIAAFLKDRGCQPTVAIWNEVTAAQCGAADVVLADSPLFGKHRGADVNRFPDTSAPVVAVGFLGTELLKAQKVTMACGYI